ncbi:WD40-repeat-containing domain protein [Protomyces lactucae-debilis]|uniref:WD40-repeat-containing domain protein n=1 Tax=Protomyces lactucae-debilis TaxID=2754530 RepID=A0A1Y2FBM9_PROLT|nr:WD40-repeat-containing domain protein [Protomyces lactucae-debilis]ORY81319.1 WD40-repeat-containing domain protein [Protomyces lactucae-debilis]
MTPGDDSANHNEQLQHHPHFPGTCIRVLLTGNKGPRAALTPASFAQMSRLLVRYTIPLTESEAAGHRLGVNALAVDPTGSGTLYSAGRDGVIAAWDLSMSTSRCANKFNDSEFEYQVDQIHGPSRMKTSIQADTNWINQMSISADYQTVYTCSSDTLVKAWRPNSAQQDKAVTLGSHGDYVKCLTVPKFTTDWIATGGLDRDIVLWDTAGTGERMRINEHSVDGGMKQSVYALAAGPNMLCSGGIEKVIRLWDTRSAQRITKFVGHTDNVRAILCSDDGKTFVSASSDSTIKIWDSTAGRCLHTMTFHSDPIWALHSEHPDLAVFYAGDRSGIVSKTDLRHVGGDKTESIALLKESSSINSLALLGDHLFTATASSSINRWRDTETMPTDPFDDPENLQASLSRMETQNSSISRSKLSVNGATRRVSTFSAASVVSLGLDSERRASVESLEPKREAPEATIQGQAGLIAHVMLSDRIHVLTRDTAGVVSLWNIAQCQKVKDYGKVDIEHVEDTLQSPLAIPSWCSVNTRVGALTVEMDPRNLLDAETYFDTVLDKKALDFDTRNRRFNLGKWMLNGLFKGLIDAELLRDSVECSRLRKRRPSKLDLGDLTMNGGGLETPRPSAGGTRSAMMQTPGSSVGLATPMPTYNAKPGHTRQSSQEPTTPVAGDYFADSHGKDKNEKDGSEPTTPGGMKTPGGGSFMKGMKWMRGNKTAKSPAADKVTPKDAVTPAAVLKSAPADLPPTNFKEVVERQRKHFVEEEKDGGSRKTWIVPLDPMPPLIVPKQVELGIADFKPGEGEAKDIYRGSVGGLTSELSKVSSILPAWLAQVLLLNEMPPAMHNLEQAKLYFCFAPLPGSKLGDPFNQPDNVMRLGAARSLRVRKALTYISQRLESSVVEQEGKGGNEEDWLEIRVNGTAVDPDWTLLMVRRHLWKQGGDMRLEYQLKSEAATS